MTDEAQLARQKAFNEQAEAMGIFMPLRTCPLKNGMGTGLGSDGNYCHKKCAWAINPGSPKANHCVIYRVGRD